jgi:hypothetical protein
LARSATITISNNDSDEGTYTFNLAGTAGGQASVKLASYKSTVTGTPNETHGSAIGDLLATYSPVSEGNIAYYNGSTTQNGCGSNKGLAHGGGTGTGYTLTVTPLGDFPARLGIYITTTLRLLDIQSEILQVEPDQVLQ